MSFPRRVVTLAAAGVVALTAACTGSTPAQKRAVGSTEVDPPTTSSTPTPDSEAPPSPPFRFVDEFDGPLDQGRWEVSRNGFDPAGVANEAGQVNIEGQAQMGTELSAIGRNQTMKIVLPFERDGKNPAVQSVDITDDGGAVVNGLPLLNLEMNDDSIRLTLYNGGTPVTLLENIPPLQLQEIAVLRLDLTNKGMSGTLVHPSGDFPFADPTPFRGPLRFEPTSQLSQDGRPVEPGTTSRLSLPSIQAEIIDSTPAPTLTR